MSAKTAQSGVGPKGPSLAKSAMMEDWAPPARLVTLSLGGYPSFLFLAAVVRRGVGPRRLPLQVGADGDLRQDAEPLQEGLPLLRV